MQLFGWPSTWSAPAHAFYGSKLSLPLAGPCVLGCGAVQSSAACDVWGFWGSDGYFDHTGG